MNSNLICRIERIINDINSDKFDQELIASLLICIREKLPPRGMAREIADFIAHPTLKDRGHVHKNIELVLEALLKGCNEQNNQMRSIITIENSIKTSESLIELNKTLQAIDPSLIILNDANRHAEIQACILLLLQGSPIKIKNLPGVESIELKIAVNPYKDLCLMAILPTPLRVPNETGKPAYPTAIKYEILTSTLKFIPQKTDMSGFGWFDGILNARRADNGRIVYSLIIPNLKHIS